MVGNASIQEAAQTFVTSMWQQHPAYSSAYAVGTREADVCDTSLNLDAPVPADGVFWTILADADPNSSHSVEAASLGLQHDGFRVHDTDDIGSRTFGTNFPVLQGIRFSSLGNGIQWENTASAVMALKRICFNASFVRGARNSLIALLERYSSIPASVLGGNFAAWQRFQHCRPYRNCPVNPGGSDTGLGWSYFRFPHTAATAWTGLALMFLDGNEDANPFGPLVKPLVEQTSDPNLACLPLLHAPPTPEPPQPVSIPPTAELLPQGKQCANHAACKHLTGDCCPTADGVMLACCSKPSQCSRYKQCSHLHGDCCPTAGGAMLACCSSERVAKIQ